MAGTARAHGGPARVRLGPDRYVITAEVPGITRDEVELALHDNRLTIRGSRSGGVPESATRRYHQVERGHGSFMRTFQFADPVSQEGITADLRDGVLTVTLPKSAAPPHTINIL